MDNSIQEQTTLKPEAVTISDVITTDLKILQQNSERASKEDALNLIPRLAKVLSSRPGLGLAAIQIGVPKRVALVLKESNDRHQHIWYELINPQILSSRGSFISEEGCLSLPGVQVRTKRANIIEVRSDAYPQSFWVEGLLAIAMQHEIDHMNGILIFSRKYIPDTYGRNDKVKIKHRIDFTEKEIKYKDLFKYQPDWYML